ncbi:hypothetical protein BV898_05112 [Hypsibius exemplaris]|uniref:Uncharacterized protein n=1 Tax=Hypsibius exemplaris TaxID=2072580 RepID=A0A1W0X0M8_HYPEX|nr:hypothetical protein BV898_05112 [Hypsibius exemplaris]
MWDVGTGSCVAGFHLPFYDITYCRHPRNLFSVRTTKIANMLRIFVALMLVETLVYCLNADPSPAETDSENALDNLFVPLALDTTSDSADYRSKRSSAFGPGLLSQITDVMAGRTGRPRPRGAGMWSALRSQLPVLEEQPEMPVAADLTPLITDDKEYEEPANAVGLSPRMAKLCYMNPVSCFGRRLRAGVDKRHVRVRFQ